MPENFESPIFDLDEIPEDRWKHLPLNCLRTKTSKDVSLTVIITCLKCTFNYDFCVRVTAHPLGTPNGSKQINLGDHQPFLRSLPDALNLHEIFPESHLNIYQLQILVELKTCLDLRFY